MWSVCGEEELHPGQAPPNVCHAGPVPGPEVSRLCLPSGSHGLPVNVTQCGLATPAMGTGTAHFLPFIFGSVGNENVKTSKPRHHYWSKGQGWGSGGCREGSKRLCKQMVEKGDREEPRYYPPTADQMTSADWGQGYSLIRSTVCVGTFTVIVRARLLILGISWLMLGKLHCGISS